MGQKSWVHPVDRLYNNKVEKDGFYYNNFAPEQKGFYYERDEADSETPENYSYWHKFGGRDRTLKAEL